MSVFFIPMPLRGDDILGVVFDPCNSGSEDDANVLFDVTTSGVSFEIAFK